MYVTSRLRWYLFKNVHEDKKCGENRSPVVSYFFFAPFLNIQLRFLYFNHNEVGQCESMTMDQLLFSFSCIKRETPSLKEHFLFFWLHNNGSEGNLKMGLKSIEEQPILHTKWSFPFLFSIFPKIIIASFLFWSLSVSSNSNKKVAFWYLCNLPEVWFTSCSKLTINQAKGAKLKGWLPSHIFFKNFFQSAAEKIRYLFRSCCQFSLTFVIICSLIIP